jgi:hypothetical protein
MGHIVCILEDIVRRVVTPEKASNQIIMIELPLTQAQLWDSKRPTGLPKNRSIGSPCRPDERGCITDVHQVLSAIRVVCDLKPDGQPAILRHGQLNPQAHAPIRRIDRFGQHLYVVVPGTFDWRRRVVCNIRDLAVDAIESDRSNNQDS